MLSLADPSIPIDHARDFIWTLQKIRMENRNDRRDPPRPVSSQGYGSERSYEDPYPSRPRLPSVFSSSWTSSGPMPDSHSTASGMPSGYPLDAHSLSGSSSGSHYAPMTVSSSAGPVRRTRVRQACIACGVKRIKVSSPICVIDGFEC